MNLRELAALFCRIIVGGILIYAGATKALGPTAEFAAGLAAYKLLPAVAVMPVALAWPWLELLTGTYILFGFETRLFSSVSAAMFLIFLGVLASTLVRGIDVASCGCFGPNFSFSPRQGIAMDAVFLILSLMLGFLSKSRQPYAVDSWINN